MIKAIHTSRKAIRDYNNKLLQFSDIESRMQRQSDKKLLPEMPIEPGLDHHLVSQGLPAHFSVKSAMARSMGINNYTGSKEHDNIIMAGIQGRQALEQGKQTGEIESKKMEQENAFKERELRLKEEQSKSSAMPSATEIAEQILSKYKS